MISSRVMVSSGSVTPPDYSWSGASAVGRSPFRFFLVARHAHLVFWP
jgi:hypothetical protein